MADAQLSPHFRLSELVVTSSGLPNVPGWRDLLNLRQLAVGTLEPIRELLGVPLRITSGFRSAAVNRAVGGSSTSQHMAGLAADIVPIGMDSETAMSILARAVRSGALRVHQLIVYRDGRGHLHVGHGDRGELLVFTADGYRPY